MIKCGSDEPPNPLFIMVLPGKYSCTSFHLVKLELPINKMASFAGALMESAFLKAFISLTKGCANVLVQHRIDTNKSIGLHINGFY